MFKDTESKIAPDSKEDPNRLDAFSRSINIHGGLGGPGGRVQRGGRPLEGPQVQSLIHGGTGGAGGVGRIRDEYSEEIGGTGTGSNLIELQQLLGLLNWLVYSFNRT
ncbi:hypothetical protein MVEN_02166500 [Mycena venus]|uniref:Uncharacterized protein n=1 Tax=Mycena venus TaxID=2733690 RepID=A0A8H7CFW9_9AGAR|nr:hypothetical protein MVEN_02166500 [Mycena venus]